ncbi:hypothetical protein [Mycobacterium sp.]
MEIQLDESQWAASAVSTLWQNDFPLDEEDAPEAGAAACPVR